MSRRDIILESSPRAISKEEYDEKKVCAVVSLTDIISSNSIIPWLARTSAMISNEVLEPSPHALFHPRPSTLSLNCKGGKGQKQSEKVAITGAPMFG